LTRTGDTERRLVAIFAADVEGYSRLMRADEVGTLRDLTQRRGILDGLIAFRRGRIANTAGDSVLAEFGSAVDAVQCAVDAQAAISEANAGLSLDRHINFRIGIHVGDVMIKGGDLFGDGVNIAARLQTLASEAARHIAPRRRCAEPSHVGLVVPTGLDQSWQQCGNMGIARQQHF
jgi:adenylate cyclase